MRTSQLIPVPGSDGGLCSHVAGNRFDDPAAIDQRNDVLHSVLRNGSIWEQERAALHGYAQGEGMMV